MFTILDTKGMNGNIRVEVIKKNLQNLEIYTIFPITENSIFFKMIRKYFRSFYLKYRGKIASNICRRINDNQLFLSFSGEFSEFYHGKIILDIDDPTYDETEIKLINRTNVLALIVTTENMKKKYEKLIIPSKPIHVVPTPVDFPTDKLVRKDFDDANTFRVIYYATFITDNDKKLINGISEKMSDIKNFQMIIIGKSESVIEGKNIKRIKYLEHNKLKDLLKTIDIGLYLRTEDRDYRLSIKIIEMMTMGLPVVSTNVTESFPISEGSCGYTISSDKIPEKIYDIYINRELVYGFSDNAIMASKKYNKKRIFEQYEKILNTYNPKSV